MSVSSACRGLASWPKAYSAIVSPWRLASTNASAASRAAVIGAPSIERLVSSATPIAAADPPPDWVAVTVSPSSLTSSGTRASLSLLGAITVAVISG